MEQTLHHALCTAVLCTLHRFAHPGRPPENMSAGPKPEALTAHPAHFGPLDAPTRLKREADLFPLRTREESQRCTHASGGVAPKIIHVPFKNTRQSDGAPILLHEYSGIKHARAVLMQPRIETRG